MANLYSGTKTFSGYKTLAELTELTFEANKTYTIQINVNQAFYIREGSEGNGFIKYDGLPFTWTFDGENNLYIGNQYAKSMSINVAG